MGLINVNVNTKPPEERAEVISKKKKAGVMNIALIILLIITLIFTGVMIYLFIQYQAVPDTLISCFFLAATGECGILGWLKTAKEKNKNTEDKNNV